MTLITCHHWGIFKIVGSKYAMTTTTLCKALLFISPVALEPNCKKYILLEKQYHTHPLYTTKTACLNKTQYIRQKLSKDAVRPFINCWNDKEDKNIKEATKQLSFSSRLQWTTLLEDIEKVSMHFISFNSKCLSKELNDEKKEEENFGSVMTIE